MTKLQCYGGEQLGIVVRNGTLISPEGRRQADILCESGVIQALYAPGEAPLADEEIDAEGLWVFPGFIDPHVHSREPGATDKEDFAHSTRAAAAGGVTTLLEMPNTIPPVDSAAVFEERAKQHAEVASVDFGLWGLSLGSENLDELPGLVAAGAVGVKLFWGYALNRRTKQLVYNTADERPEDLMPPPDNGEVLRIFEVMAKTGGLLAAHCEDKAILEGAQRGLPDGIETYDDLIASRPDTAEASTIALGAEFARFTGCRFHVVHTSSSLGLGTVRGAQARGISITAETCPQYLTLTDQSYESIGPLMKVYPPVRAVGDRNELWDGLRDGSLQSVGSDHAPHTVEQKQQSLEAVPAGAVGVETIGPLMIDAAARGVISPERLSWVMSEGTSRIYGLHPTKGSIVPGADADLTLVDPEGHSTISDEKLHSKHPASPWNGTSLAGRLRFTILRGRIIMQDGELSGEPGGIFVRSAAGDHHNVDVGV